MQRRLKVLPPWLSVMMDDIEDSQPMDNFKGKELEEEEEDADDFQSDQEDEEAGHYEWMEDEDIKEDKDGQEDKEECREEEGGASNAKEDSADSTSLGLGDTPPSLPLEIVDTKEVPAANTDTFSRFASMTLNVDLVHEEVVGHLPNCRSGMHYLVVILGTFRGIVKQHRPKLQICSSMKTRVVVDVSSPPGAAATTHVSLNFSIQNGQLRVMEEGGGRVVTTRGNIAAARLGSIACITFTSDRFKLSVNVDQRLVSDILRGEASSRTIDLFGQWMEHTLPPTILRKVHFVDSLWFTMEGRILSNFLQRQFSGVDMSELVFCFWPVICRHHWTLFALYLNRGARLLRLPGKKHYLIHFDSLKGLTNAFECLEQVKSGLRSLAEFVHDNDIRRALADSKEEIELKVVDVPQQTNAIDCGFYVMRIMRELIAGGLEDRPGRHWFTKDWFKDVDVCTLRVQLHDWCLRCLAEV
ncbi:hypothetical protein GOP47_0003182 [Adiantum capillus-veneris]|uniref:Ubiquitin-like protease family profile domain-containing protein n=1 Tax=Adiantum capillus-veneris TaxID=13818 RepID=A0A9D4ZPU8_ADICA|nr:hypothetical protein GOP47_0003182 [Adiantum capillus-veneris]